MEERLNRLLRLTEKLQEHVLNEQDDPDVWIQILDERQKVIDELQSLTHQGNTLQEHHRQLIGNAIKIGRELGPIMEKAKKNVNDQLKLMERSRLAKKQYAGSEHYGRYDDLINSHFFDQKK